MQKRNRIHKLACILPVLVLTMCPERVQAADGDAEIQRELAAFEQLWQQADAPNSPCHISNVLKLIDLDYKGLEKVKAAAAAGDLTKAEAELLAYFRTTRAADYRKPRLNNETRAEADNALRHFFRGNRKVYPPIYRGVKIDWRNKAVNKGQTIHDAEWLFQYHRFTWWPALADAYGATGDERYFREWRYELVDYFRANLPITRKTPWFIRRGMENYCRCNQHTRVLPSFIRSPGFDGKLLRWFLVSFHLQAEHIRTVYAHDGNHLVGELEAVFKNGLAYPEFRKSKEWIAEALDRFPKLMFSEMYEDGMNKELIFSYHGMYVELFSNFYRLAKEHGYADRLPPEYLGRLRKACDVATYHMFPDFTMSQFGDGWKGSPGNNWLFRAHACKLFPDVPYYEFMRNRGTKGTPPPKTSVAFPQSGFYTFRSDWTRDAVYMSIKCGEKAEFHNQIDNGTFELYAFGRNFMIDSGCYVYNSDSREGKAARAWFRSTRAHQTLTLDNKNAERKPNFLFWSDHPNLTALSFENQSYPNLTHRRTVLFVNEQYFVIYDEAIGNAAGTVRTHYQFVPCDCAMSATDLTAATKFKTGANLVVKSFPQQPGVTMAEEEGWISYKQRQKQKRPAWSYAVRKRADQPQVSFLTILAPFKTAAPPQIKADIVRAGQHADVRLQIGRIDHRIDIDWDNHIASFVD